MNLFNRILLGTVITFGSIYRAQYLKVEYERTDLHDTKLSGVSQKFEDKVNANRKIPQKFVLYYADGNAFYKSIPKASFSHNAGDTRKDENTVLHKKEIYKDDELKVYYHKKDKGIYGYYNFPNIKEEFYGYKESKFSQIDYKEETIQIDNYPCKLVEVSFEHMPATIYKIWYTEDIPIVAGPNGFNVFPGLVLRVECDTFVLTAVKISNDGKLSDIEKINPKLKIYKNEELDAKMKDVMERVGKTSTEEIKL